MPKPAKGRKKTTGVGAGEAADLLNAINSQGLDERDLLRILKVERTPCDHVKSPCKSNRKDNVACFCQLVPAGTSFRKKGLWQKEQAYLGTLGADPEEQKREDAANPSGLRNLGNTCYANAALQCLFSIPSLRNGIYGAEAQVAAHDIFRQLQTLFLHMQFGPRSSVDTEALAKTLGLNHAIQQDGQEFLKLLLMRVEQLLSKSCDTAARGLVQRLFRGGLSYVTTCQRCGRDSATSREVQDFYDLMPQVRGFANLTDSLAAILHSEWLTGDNQYRCEFCSEKVDAVRHVRLRSLPPYLCLALQRFYFDPRTADKAKALDKFSFPLQLDFRHVLETAATTAAEEAQPSRLVAGAADAAAAAAAATAAALEVPQYAAGSPLYELVGILIHKGSQASSGHYVAHIKDQASGQWWRFDDESAECIGPDPTAKFTSDHGAASASAAAAGAENGKAAGTSRRRAAGGDGAGGDDPDYDFDQDAQDQSLNADGDNEGTPAKSGRGGRGKKRGAASRPRGRAPKRAAVAANGGGGSRSGRGRQRGTSPGGDADGDPDEDDDIARAVAASLEPQTAVGGGGGRGRGRSRPRRSAVRAADADGDNQGEEVDGDGDAEDMDLQRALAASKQEQHAGDLVMAAALRESARAQATEAGASLRDEEALDAAMKASLEDAAAASPPAPGGAQSAGTEEEPGASLEVAAMAAGERFGGTIAFEPGAIWATAMTAASPQRRQPQPQQVPPPAADGAAGAVQAAPQLGGQGVVVSANAYMLVYRAVGFDEPPALAEVAALSGELQEAVSVDAAAFLEQCDVYQRQRQAMKDQVESRRRAVRELLTVIAPGSSSAKQSQPQQDALDLTGSGAPASGDHGLSKEAEDLTGADADAEASPRGPTGFWVSTAWLERWANDEAAPPPIDNSPILCTKHGPAVAGGGVAGSTSGGDGGDGARGEAEGGGGGTRPAVLDPNKATAAKLVSPEAWRRLHEAHGGGPALAAGDVCLGCLANNFNATLLGSQANGVRARVAALLEEAAKADAQEVEAPSEGEDMEEDEAGPPGTDASRRFWVSKYWLQGWSRRQGASVKAEKSPTADVVCPHGQLLPAALTKSARRVAVPADIWLFLRDLWRQQRIREAQEEARGGGGGAGKAGRPGRPGASRGAGSAPVAVDCMDLTGEEPTSAKSGSGAAAAAAAGADSLAPAGGDRVVDDDVVEVTEVNPGQQRGRRTGPLAHEASREGSVDTEDPVVTGETAAAPPSAVPAPVVPTPEVLDALCVELPVGRVHECPVCRAAAGQAAEAQADTKRQAEAERAALGSLAADVVPTLEPGGRYYMVPSAWVREWQQYVRGVARRGAGPSSSAAASGAGAPAGGSGPAVPTVAARPGSLREAMLRVLCPCHPEQPRLGVPAPRVVAKRSKLCQQDCEQEALRVVHSDEWQQLCRFYGVADPPAATKGAPAAAAPNARAQRAARRARAEMYADIIDDDEAKPSKQPDAAAPAGGVDGTCAQAAAPAGPSAGEMAVRQGFAAEVVSPAADGTGGGGAAAAVFEDPGPFRDRSQRDIVVELHVWPPVCSEALQEHHRMAREALLSYRDVEVMVELVTQEELETAFRDVVNAERKSKRSRKGRMAVMVSNTTTLEQLKLQVYENLSVHPRNQALYVRGEDGCPRQLEGDELSLAQHEVLPGQEIRLVRLNLVDDDDDVAGLLGDGRSKRRQVEEGFKNTALHGDLPQQQQPKEGDAAGGSGCGHQSDTVLSDTVIHCNDG